MTHYRKERRARAIRNFLIAAFIGWYIVSMLVNVAVAHAETVMGPEPIYQNDYYCKLIRDKGVPVKGAQGSLKELCAKHGVTL